MNIVEEGGATFFGFGLAQISDDEIMLIVDFKEQFDKSAFGLIIEHISAAVFVQSINWSIKEQETFPSANGRLDQIFPLIEKNRQKFVFERSDIVVADGQEVYHN